MFKIIGIDHIVLRTNKIESMLNFYCDILGATVERVQKELHLTQVRIGRNLIDLVEVDTVATEALNLEHFCLQIAPFDYEFLQEHFAHHHIDIVRYGKRYSSNGPGYSFYLRDPQGNEIELAE